MVGNFINEEVLHNMLLIVGVPIFSFTNSGGEHYARRITL